MGSDRQRTHPANDTSAINNGTATNTGNAFPVNVVLFKKPGLFLQSSRHLGIILTMYMILDKLLKPLNSWIYSEKY